MTFIVSACHVIRYYVLFADNTPHSRDNGCAILAQLYAIFQLYYVL